MLRRNFLKGLGLVSAASVIPATNILANNKLSGNNIEVSGTIQDRKGSPLVNVSVSDGYTVVMTDSKGFYSIVTNAKAKFVFVSIPSGYEIPNKKGIASFYEKIDRSAPHQKVDFKLDKLALDDQHHAFVVWADPQIQSKDDAHQFTSVSAPDTQKEIQKLGNIPIHGIGCGDLVFDHPELYDDYRTAVAVAGVPFFQVIGNHDQTYGVRTDDFSQEYFTDQFGPVNYSFNRGAIHYVFLDNVFFIGQGHRYIGYLREDTLEWLEQDLSHLPQGSTVIVSLHIPSNTGEARRNKMKEDSMGGVTMNREALYKILKPYKAHLISGHTHWNETWENEQIMEHDLGTLCGAWWTGPICGDGAPCGYMVFDVNADKISWYYKSTGFDKSHQITIHKEDSLPEYKDMIVANVWNVDKQWKVEWWEGDTYKGIMEQFTGYDPEAYKLYLGPQLPKKHKWVEPCLTDHLFKAMPSDKTKNITVKATDRFGNVYQETLKR